MFLHFHLGFRASERLYHGIKHSCFSAESQIKLGLHEKPFTLFPFLRSPLSRLPLKCEKAEAVWRALLTLMGNVAIYTR